MGRAGDQSSHQADAQFKKKKVKVRMIQVTAFLFL